MRLHDDAALNRVYGDLVLPLLFEALSASAAPEPIMVRGQPGAGKMAATVQAVRDLMRQPDVFRRSAEQFTAQGFEFEMRVVVVDPEASQLGIYERFATGLASPSA